MKRVAKWKKAVVREYDARRAERARGVDRAPTETVNLKVSDQAETEALALSLIEDQKKKAGANYGYCACSRAVSSRTARRAKAAGMVLKCSVCAAAASRSKDDRVFLCSQHRGPLPDHRLRLARYNAKRGVPTTCGAPECIAAQRREDGLQSAASLTSAQRSERARRSWETRRARAAAAK